MVSLQLNYQRPIQPQKTRVKLPARFSAGRVETAIVARLATA